MAVTQGRTRSASVTPLVMAVTQGHTRSASVTPAQLSSFNAAITQWVADKFLTNEHSLLFDVTFMCVIMTLTVFVILTNEA